MKENQDDGIICYTCLYCDETQEIEVAKVKKVALAKTKYTYNGKNYSNIYWKSISSSIKLGKEVSFNCTFTEDNTTVVS